jgi:hypothetical protein
MEDGADRRQPEANAFTLQQAQSGMFCQLSFPTRLAASGSNFSELAKPVFKYRAG